jgi:fructuronate reductase
MRRLSARGPVVTSCFETPAYDRAAQRLGIVHLGIGAFHRAHQAVYTDEAMAAGDRGWAIQGVSLRSSQVADALNPQGGLYSVTERGPGGDHTRLVAAVRGVIVACEAQEAVTCALSSPDTRVVTLTVTEKGYHRGPDGDLDLASVERAGNTIYHHLAAALAKRFSAGLSGMTLISCDNLAENGGILQRSIANYLNRTSSALRAWFDAECACPSTMVDRIVPATTSCDLEHVAEVLGFRDEGAVVTEPFRQWVIEDRFAGSRPRWEVGGAQFVADVRPYEVAKLRMLNGAHSALAYLGLLAGHTHVHEAIADPAIWPMVELLMRSEAASSLQPAPGQDLQRYADGLIARFGNSALPHRLDQIASDGSQKIGPRWLDSLTENRKRGRRCPATLQALAAWILHVRADARPVADPLADRLAQIWRAAGAAGVATALFGPQGLLAAQWVATDNDLTALTDAIRRGLSVDVRRREHEPTSCV